MNELIQHRAVVIGVSLGGMDALPIVLGPLPENFPVPIMIVQHLHPSDTGFLIEYLDARCALNVSQAKTGESCVKGCAYLAPADCHLSVVNGGTLTLSDGEKVNHSRPSIDVLFKSAARSYGPRLIGVLLTGASVDGASGMASIKEYGGMTIVQDPTTAESSVMPQSAIDARAVDYVMPLEGIAGMLENLVRN